MSINSIKKKLFFPLLKTISVCVILIAGLNIEGNAQEPMRISLEEARQYAVEHNKNLTNAGLTVNEAGAQLRETIAQGLPQVNASVDYNNFLGASASLGPGFDIEFNPTSNLGVNVSQLIFSGSYFVGVRMARLYKEMMHTSRERSELEIRADVSQFYFLSLISMISLEILESNISNMDELLEQTRALVSVGIAEEVDYDQLSVQAGMLADAKKAAERQVEISLNMLRLQMGLDADSEIILTDAFETILEKTNFQRTIELNFATETNLDFQLMSLQTQMAEKQLSMERAAYLPSIVGFYNYTEKLLRPEFDITPNHVVGLNMNIPLFSSGARRARVSQARINLEIAQNQQDLLIQQLEIQNRQLKFNLNNALEQYNRQKTNMDVAQRVYNNINNKYQHGMVSSLDLTTANNNFLQARNSYISALFQLMEAHVALEKMLNLL